MVVIDPERKFSLPVPEWPEIRDTAVKGINRYADMFRSRGLPVIFVHYDGESHIPYKGDDGDEWLEGIVTEPSDIVVHKTCMSCFKKTVLEKTLKDLGVDCIMLCGMLTEFCVASTYFGASERDLSAGILVDALISYSPEGLDAAKVLLNWADDEVIEKFLDGKQGPLPTFDRSETV